jgi:hypothetical protein
MNTLPEKLGIKPGLRVLLRNLPEMIDVDSLTGGSVPVAQLRGAFDIILAFVTKAAQLDRHVDAWKKHLALEGRIWICWPKAGGPETDLNIKTVIGIGYRHGMVESNAIRIDDQWAALKFTHPKAGKEYRNSYGDLNPDAVLHYRK